MKLFDPSDGQSGEEKSQPPGQYVGSMYSPNQSKAQHILCDPSGLILIALYTFRANTHFWLISMRKA